MLPFLKNNRCIEIIRNIEFYWDCDEYISRTIYQYYKEWIPISGSTKRSVN